MNITYEQKTNNDIDVKRWFSDDEAVQNVVKDARSTVINVNLLKEDSQNSAMYKAIFCLFIQKGAKDFYSFTRPEYSDLEDHHITPKSWGLKNNITNINSILNRAPISDISNKKIIRDRLPNVYISELFTKHQDTVYEILDSHFISKEMINILINQSYGEQEFNQFLLMREKLIKVKLAELVGLE